MSPGLGPCFSSNGAKGPVETAERFVGLGFGHHQRRQQAYDRFGRSVDDDALRERGRDDRRRITRQFESPNQAAAPHLVDERVSRGDRFQSLLEVSANATDARQESAADQLVEKTKRGTAGEQIPAVRAAVIAKRNGRRDILADQRSGDRYAAAERLAY